MNDTLQELNRNLLVQDFEDVENSSDISGRCRRIARMYAEMENAVAVLSDMRSDRSCIYYGGMGEMLGMASRGTFLETDSIWEKEIFERMSPGDLMKKHVQELRFFHFRKSLSPDVRTRCFLMSRLKMKNASGGEVQVCHRMFYIEDSSGNVAFALCLYTLCRDEHPDVIIDSLTGEQIDIGRQSCGTLLSKRECEVLGLIGQGKSSKEIAGTLSVSIHTVSRHRQNILRKLHAGNSVNAVAIAKKLNLL